MEPRHGTGSPWGLCPGVFIAYELLGEQCARLREQHEPRCGLVVPGILSGLQMVEDNLKLDFQVSGTIVQTKAPLL